MLLCKYKMSENKIFNRQLQNLNLDNGPIFKFMKDTNDINDKIKFINRYDRKELYNILTKNLIVVNNKKIKDE
jgi:hypothetical protein